jgi:signal transduction histidine kinase/PAS domain-containing protein
VIARSVSGHTEIAVAHEQRATASADPVAADTVGILDTIDVPIIVVGLDCTVACFNPAATDTLGLTPADIGRLPSEIQVLAELKNFHELCSQVVADGAPCQREIRNGNRWFLLRIAPYMGSDQQIRGAVLTFTNVTAFRASIDQAVYEREYTKAILNTVIQPLVVLDSDLRVQTGNRAFYDMFRVPREATQGVPLCDLGNGEWNLPGLSERLKAVVSNDHEFKGFEVEGEFPCIGRRTLLLDGRRLTRDANVLILLGLLDITESKRAAQALRQSQAQLQAELADSRLLHNISNALIQEDNAEAVYEAILEAATGIMRSDFASMQMLYPERGEGGQLRLLGFRGFDPQSARNWEWVGTDSRCSCGLALRNGERVVVTDVDQCEAMAGSADYETYRLSGIRAVQSTPLRSRNGKTLGMISTHWREPHEPSERDFRLFDILARQAADLMERKQAEQALRESQGQLAKQARELERLVAERTASLRETLYELESWSYSIAHDMRAPLRSMRGFSEILLQEYSAVIDNHGRDFLNRIARSSSRLDRLIEDVLNYSKILRAEIINEPVDVGRLIQDIIDTYPDWEASKAEIQIEGSLPKVLGNEAFLTQCISNLLTNAVKFVAPGTLPRVRIRAEEAAALRVRICFQDNGIGIAPEKHSRIFRMFERINPAIKYEGTGIGLTVAQKAVERMGGRIGLDSVPGKGSTFWIEVPAIPPGQS